MRRIAIILLALVPALAMGDPQPSLDDFYERTRERADGFVGCTGYCDGHRLAALVVGVQTANPSDDQLAPHVATGLRLGGDFGLLRERDVVRSQVWADVLRVNETGNWFTDLGWHTTAFKRWGHHPSDEFDLGTLHAQLDTVLARRTELQISDLAELVERPYTLADVEAEVAPVGGRIDKEARLALPVGVAERLRWTDGAGPERRTTVSVAAVARAFPKGIRHHAQFDFIRLKRTGWEAAHAWTVSTGYQRLPQGIDTLPIWALVGYEWAGTKGAPGSGPSASKSQGSVFQVGGAYRADRFEVGGEYARHFELAPGTTMFSRVDSGRFGVKQHVGRVRLGIAAETVSIAGRGNLRALTPEVGITAFGLELVARYRAAWTHDVMFPADRFHLGLDWLL